jgi:thioredoxin-like negative regulator of GroEL
MGFRRFLVTSLVFGSVFCLGEEAFARTLVPYEETKVQEAMTGGKPVLVEVYADWCPSCKKGHVALEKALDGVADIAAFQIDFDKDEELLKKYGVEEQGTVLIVKEGKEVARLAGEHRVEAIVEWIKAKSM